MRLTESQLRSIIRRAILINEGDDANKGEGESVPTSKEAGINWGANYSSFIKSLKGGAKDPKVQAFIRAGKLDNDENDDKFTFSETTLDVAGLKPTQNEIDVDKSLAWPMKKAKTFIEYAKGDGQAFTLGSPIVTYAGQYVIDGHHRWSQLYACNKDAKITAVDITVEGLQPLDVLKAVQTAIAVMVKDVPTQAVEGINLLKIDKSGLENWISSKVDMGFFAKVAEDQEVIKILEEAGGGSAKNEAAEVSQEDLDKVTSLITGYIWSNVQDMQANSQPVSGAPKRDLMPQTDNVDWRSPLEAGVVDIVPPHAEDVKKESRYRRSNDQVVLERWQKLAGLIKG